MTTRPTEWRRAQWPVLDRVAAERLADGVLAGVRVALHRDLDTGVLADVLEGVGARVRVVDPGPAVEADLLLDHGGALTMPTLASLEGGAASLGVVEVAATGAAWARRLEAYDALPIPVVAVWESACVGDLVGPPGVAQTTLQELLRVTNQRLPGARVAILGYDAVARRLADVVRGMGGRPMFAVRESLPALRAHLAGHEVAEPATAVAGAAFVVVTGHERVVPSLLATLRTSAVLVSAVGPDRIDLAGLDEVAAGPADEIRPGLTRYRLRDDRTVFVVAGGAPVALDPDLSAGTLDLVFATAVLACRVVLAHGLPGGVHPVPTEVEEAVAAATLAVAGVPGWAGSGDGEAEGSDCV